MAKKVSKKKVLKADRVARVRRALENFVRWDGVKVLKVSKVVSIETSTALLYLGGGKWSLSSLGSVSGVIGGYNRMAISVVEGLRKLRLLTRADEQAFYDWYRSQMRKSEKAGEIRRARDIAARHGYSLRKVSRGGGLGERWRENGE